MAEIVLTRAGKKMKNDMFLYLGLKMLVVHNQVNMISSVRKSAKKAKLKRRRTMKRKDSSRPDKDSRALPNCVSRSRREGWEHD